MPDTRSITVVLPEHVYTFLKTQADEDDRPLSRYVARVLKTYVENQDGQQSLV